MTDSISLRVLVVDDEQIIADSLGLIVETQGHRVRVAYDGAEAAGIAQELKPNACITDVMMPKMDGVELAMWLAEHHPQCNVLLISGYTQNLDAVERMARHGRPANILAKPVSPVDIFRFLATCSRVH